MAGEDGGPSGTVSEAGRDDLRQWLALHHAQGLGARRKLSLLEHFGSVRALFAAGRTDLEHVLGERSTALDGLLADAERHAPSLAWHEQAGNFIVTWTDPDYPPLLREIADPPVLLYGVGQRSRLASPQIAVVGSRNPTPAGRANARAFAEHLAQAGFAITSGLALGIDAAAHEGALAVGAVTVAVTGTGLDRVYPPRHRALAHRIAEDGVLLSEFGLGTPPRAENFPIRNRLISGMSVGVLVVEAALRSGSLITARLAAEQGREVFAIPGSIHSPLARGCHTLIRQGAKLVETAADVLEELAPLARAAMPVPPPSIVATGAISDEETRLLECLGHDPADIDTLAERCGLTPQAVSSMLLALELRGRVATLAGGRYQRVS
jgi:DNA processing protein